MLAGNTKEVGKRIENVYTNGGENFSGLGSTLEGFDVNPFMYEYVFSKAWDCNLPDSVWIEQLADRRIGLRNQQMRRAWKLLYSTSCFGTGDIDECASLFKRKWQLDDYAYGSVFQ